MISLNPKLFDADVEQAPIRAGSGEGLLVVERMWTYAEIKMKIWK